uniref:Uncharacterized protein n=1 Tax=Oreochromis aureus TaxID=47969 RepID=A0A668S6C7_OREAU
MAGKHAFIKSHLRCQVCSKIFRDPVTLTCNHSFCLSCLKTIWEKTKKKICPLCERKNSKKNLGINFPLKEMADSFAQRQKAWAVCSEHEKEPQLFCVDEDKPLCPVCDFPHHQSHKVIPVEAAIDVLKEQVSFYFVVVILYPHVIWLRVASPGSSPTHSSLPRIIPFLSLPMLSCQFFTTSIK